MHICIKGRIPVFNFKINAKFLRRPEKIEITPAPMSSIKWWLTGFILILERDWRTRGKPNNCCCNASQQQGPHFTLSLCSDVWWCLLRFARFIRRGVLLVCPGGRLGYSWAIRVCAMSKFRSVNDWSRNPSMANASQFTWDSSVPNLLNCGSVLTKWEEVSEGRHK